MGTYQCMTQAWTAEEHVWKLQVLSRCNINLYKLIHLRTSSEANFHVGYCKLYLSVYIVCVCVCVCVCAHVRMYVYVHSRMHVCVCVHIYPMHMSACTYL
jgi:hypothetical protein